MMNGTNIEESKISNGILEFEKFKAAAASAIERCKKAEEEANFHKGQNELLVAQKQEAEARHRADLTRIAELETFVSNILEQYRSAEEKLRLGHFRRPGSIAARHPEQVATAADRIPSSVIAAIETELAKPMVAQGS
jgi:hypothetical protein